MTVVFAAKLRGQCFFVVVAETERTVRLCSPPRAIALLFQREERKASLHLLIDQLRDAPSSAEELTGIHKKQWQG